MAGFEVIIYGRFWVIAEDPARFGGDGDSRAVRQREDDFAFHEPAFPRDDRAARVP